MEKAEKNSGAGTGCAAAAVTAWRTLPNGRSRDAQALLARTLLHEARARAGIPAQRGFCFWLIEHAGRARRRAMSLGQAAAPRQAELWLTCEGAETKERRWA